jgi:histidinol-phosphate aminotransferase
MSTAQSSQPGAPAVRLSAAGVNARPYAPPRPADTIDLFLDANEGPAPLIDAVALAALIGPHNLRRYPDAAPLTRLLAQRLGADESRILVTAGGDDAIDRACRACLEPGRELLLPMPTFEMIARYARQTGASVVTTPWLNGPYPVDAVLRAITPRTAMIAVVSPNNPTGAVATQRDLERIAAAAPQALILADLAYAEFAADDLTDTALTLPNVLAVRTFSKAFGLAGLRVGYAIGAPPVIEAVRAVGGPFPVSSISLAAAAEALRIVEAQGNPVVQAVRAERQKLALLLSELGAQPFPSQANFVLARFPDADRVWRELARQGIAVRRFVNQPPLEQMLRITCPGDAIAFDRLCRTLRAIP